MVKRCPSTTAPSTPCTLAGHVACLAGARPEAEYQALLAGAGLRVVRTEAHDEALARMVGQIDARLRALGAIGLPGVDLAAAEPYLAAAARAVRSGIAAGYRVLAAVKD